MNKIRQVVALRSLRIVKRSFGEKVQLTGSNNLIAGRVRFYKTVDVKAEDEGMFGVMLDGRNLKTVQMNRLLVPSEDLAWAIANEWDAQTDKKRGLVPATMPLTTLASTAIDQIAIDPTLARDTVLSYLPTDSAVFFTQEHDRLLLEKQKELLEPVLEFLNAELGIKLKTTTSMHLKLIQDDSTVKKIKDIVYSMDPHTLSCLQTATLEYKSILMAMAHVLYGHINAENGRKISRIEEEFQLEIWGVVEGGHDMDRLNNAVNLGAIGYYMNLLRN